MAGFAFGGYAGSGMYRRLGLVKFRFVAGIASSGGAGRPFHMAAAAIGTLVSSREREIGFGVIEPALLFTPGMAGKTGGIVVLITIGFPVGIIHARFTVLMAFNAAEAGIITCLLMAVGAGAPDIRMLPGIHREKPRIMFREFRRFPGRISCMAIQAIGGQIDLLMVGING